MHPLFARPIRLLLYFATWLILGLLLGGVLMVATPRTLPHAMMLAIPLSVFYGAVCLSAWWVCRAAPLENGRLLDAALSQGGAALQSSGVWTGAATLWSVLLFQLGGVGLDRAGVLRDLGVLFVLGLPLYLLSAVVHYLFLAVDAAHQAAERALRSQVMAREAELRALRAQLNPHFLFNSLNSINALVGGDPEGARRMCEGLGDFLRRTLQLGGRERVALGEELALVEGYLAIEQVRFGERLRVERAVDPRALECQLPPLLLQPLIENAIKHGVADRIEGGTVRLAAYVAEGRLMVAIENPVDDDAPSRRGGGLGLDNVRRRLEALGTGAADLAVTREPGRFRVTLSLPASSGSATLPAAPVGEPLHA